MLEAMKRILGSILFFLSSISLVAAEECSTAFVCDVVNHQRMHLNGSLQELSGRPFRFRLDGSFLIPQKGGSPLGDGTLNYKIDSPFVCGADGRLISNTYNKHYQFEGDNGLYAFEYKNGRMLISSHVHHDFFELVAAKCSEL